MQDEEVWRIYTALADRAEALDIFCWYLRLDGGQTGWFDPREGTGRRPAIALDREYPPSEFPSPTWSAAAPPGTAPPDLLAELCTFAHELGHYLSWLPRKGTAEFAEYADAARRQLGFRQGALPMPTARQIELVMTEELEAWRLGREALEQLGFADWQAFEAVISGRKP